MRRLLVVTVAQAVAITALLVGLAVAALLLWPGDPLKSLAAASRPGLRGHPADARRPRRARRGRASSRGASPSPSPPGWPTGGRPDVAHFLATLGERAERLGPGRPPPGAAALRASRRSTGSTRPWPAAPSRAPSAWPPSATSPPTPRTSCAPRSPRCSCASRRSRSTDDLAVVEEEATIAIDQVERLSRVVDDLMSRTRSGVDANPAVSLDSVLASLQREWQPAFAGARRSIHVQRRARARGPGDPDGAGPDPHHAARELARRTAAAPSRSRPAGPARRSSSRSPTRATACRRRSRRTSSSARCRRRAAGSGSRWRATSPRPPAGASSWCGPRPPLFALFLSASAI